MDIEKASLSDHVKSLRLLRTFQVPRIVLETRFVRAFEPLLVRSHTG